jgi:hypothetical protein
VIRLNKRFVFWLAPGVVTFTLAFAGCQKKEEPVPAANPAPAAAPPGNAPAAAGAVAPGSGSSDTGLGSSAATGESKKARRRHEDVLGSHFSSGGKWWEAPLGLPIVVVQ